MCVVSPALAFGRVSRISCIPIGRCEGKVSGPQPGHAVSRRGDLNAWGDIRGRLASGGAAFVPGWELVFGSETIEGTGWIVAVVAAEGMNLTERLAELK